MSTRIAIIAGGGILPWLLADALPDAVFVTIAGQEADIPDEITSLRAEIERIGTLFADLRAAGVGAVVFAGALIRPALDPARFDDVMKGFAPRLIPALQSGDDALLREVVDLFEAQGFAVRAPVDVLPELCLSEGEMLGRDMREDEAMDAIRGHEILATLAPLDLGQGCVVAAGLCLGIETLQGTDAMLRFVGQTPPALRRAPGVLVKAPKRGQDTRVDMPAIGPDTITAAHEAGLAGIVIHAQGVMVLERDALEEALLATGLFLAAL